MVSARWNGRPLKAKSIPGNAMLMSAGQDSSWACSNSMDELLIFLDPVVVTEVAEDAGIASLWLHDGLGLVNPGLQVVASQILSELEAPEVATRLFADTLARTLALHLVRRHSTARPVEARLHQLSPRQLHAATDFIDSFIDHDLSLKSIADAAAISPFRFARGFREALGQSPRQYVITRRIERAKELLKGTDQSLAEIGSQVGFATQSHFTAMFRRRCGMTPKRYRDTIGN
jgi:AraC family transcriptional regulator